MLALVMITEYKFVSNLNCIYKMKLFLKIEVTKVYI